MSSFRGLWEAALKAGSYGVFLSPDDVGVFLSQDDVRGYRSVAGWSSIPFRNPTTCEIEPREYVWGVFVHAADTYSQTVGIREVGAETLCEANLFVTNVQVVDLDDPLPGGLHGSQRPRLLVHRPGQGRGRAVAGSGHLQQLRVPE